MTTKLTARQQEMIDALNEAGGRKVFSRSSISTAKALQDRGLVEFCVGAGVIVWLAGLDFDGNRVKTAYFGSEM
jgi:hypothetical protein